MLSRKELSSYIGLIHFQNIQQIETDYLQNIMLAGIYSTTESRKLYFKGGTALQKIFGLNRFSIDLDFTGNLSIKELTKLINIVKQYMEFHGFRCTLSSTEKKDSISYKFKIFGPIYLSTHDDRAIATIKIDVSSRENIVLPITLYNITPLYRDLEPYQPIVMDPNEMLAEKIRAILTRRKPRDVFDLDFLLDKGFNFFYSLIEKKLAVVEKELPNGLSKNNLSELYHILIQRINELTDDWDKELKNLIMITRNERIYSSNVIVQKRLQSYFNKHFSYKIIFNKQSKISMDDKNKYYCTFKTFSYHRFFNVSGEGLRAILQSDLNLFTYPPPKDNFNINIIINKKEMKDLMPKSGMPLSALTYPKLKIILINSGDYIRIELTAGKDNTIDEVALEGYGMIS